MTITEPLTPPDCDLRDFQFMPMDIVRLFGSRFHAVASDAEWRAGITLWLKSFHQVPAASIPDDDVELARLAELGRDLRTWKKIRAGALHGWVKCSDGRFYHPVVAEKANEAFKKKEFYRERSKKASAKRWGGMDHQGEPEASQEEGSKVAGGDLQAEPTALQEASLKHASSNASASQGTVRVKGQGKEDDEDAGAGAGDLPPEPLPADCVALAAEFARIAGVRHLEPNTIGRHVDLVRSWMAEGLDPETDIIPAIREGVTSATAPIHSLKYFDPAVRQAKARKEASRHVDPANPTRPSRASGANVLARLRAEDAAAGFSG